MQRLGPFTKKPYFSASVPPAGWLGNVNSAHNSTTLI